MGLRSPICKRRRSALSQNGALGPINMAPWRNKWSPRFRGLQMGSLQRRPVGLWTPHRWESRANICTLFPPLCPHWPSNRPSQASQYGYYLLEGALLCTSRGGHLGGHLGGQLIELEANRSGRASTQLAPIGVHFLAHELTFHK